MSGKIFVIPKQVPIVGGTISPGAKATFSETGTTTPQNTYTDIALTVPHANPVVADASGVFAVIYFDTSFVDYRLKLTKAEDSLIYQLDNIPSSELSDSLVLSGSAPSLTLIETDAAPDNEVWRLLAAA